MRAVGEVSGAVAPTWHEQYERMLRWLERLSESTTHDDRHLDDFHAFFITCFHLKDWLQEDPAVDTKIRGEVEGFLASNLWLRLCADLANGSKHLDVNKTPRYDLPARLEKRTGKGSIVVVTQGKNEWPALVIAKKCARAWQPFLVGHALI
jgi:hypothetical protein